MHNTITKWKTAKVKVCSKIIWFDLSYISYPSMQDHGEYEKGWGEQS